MVQVINDPNRSQSLVGSLTNGLSSALQGLAQHKVNEIQQKKVAQTLGNAFPDLPKGSLQFLSQLPPKEQMEYLQGLGEQERAQQPQGQQQQPGELTEEQIMKYLPQFLQSPEAQQAFSPEEHAELLKMVSQPQQTQKPEQGLKLSQLGAGKTKGVNVQVQNNIDRKYQKYNDYVDNARDNADSIINTGEKLKSLVEKGDVSEGLVGDIREKFPFGLAGANENTREFVSNANQLIDDSANLIKGVATNFKIKLKQAAKVNLGMPNDVKLRRIQQAVDSAQKARDIGDIRDQIVEENGGIPENLPTLVRKRYQKWEQEHSKGPDLDTKDYADDDVVEENGVLYEKSQDGKSWQVYKGKVK